MNRSIIGILLLICSCTSTKIPDAQSLDQIQIVRDQWGVPHIMAPTDEEVAYGFGWAQCEDDFVTMQEQMLVVRGHLGEVRGKAGIVGDFGIKFMGLRELVEAQYEKDLSLDFRGYLQSYADGINSYAALHPEEVLLKKLFPLQPQDIVMGYMLGTVELSQARQHLERILDESIVNDKNANFPKGSNAIAISSKRTKDGKTYLAINSHQPLEGWYSWYEAHLISDEGLNILGGTFPGGVTIFHGVNEHLGWAHTVNHVDLSDVYQLEMHPENALQYRFDDQWLSLEEKVYRAKLHLFAGIKIPIKRKVYQSVYGPTFKTDQGFFAWRYVVAQDIRAIEQWYRMNKAKNFEDFKQALAMQAIPSTNIVYADRADNIFFISNAKVPVRDTNYVWREVVPGNSAATLWDSYYPIDSLPQVLNPRAGYVYNTNNTPFSSSSQAANPSESDLNFTMSFQSPDMENSRSIRFQELIGQYDTLSYEDFKRIKFDRQYGDQIQTREMLNLDLLFQMDPEEHRQYADLIQQLKEWNRQFEIENTTAPLFIYIVQKLIEDLRAQDRYCWRCSITEGDILAAFEKATVYFEEKYGTFDVALGDFQRHTRGDVSLPLGGGPDVLAAMHSREQEDGTFRGMAGESYIELVRFSKEGVEIETVHAYGSSAEPDSPHYTDQMELFVKQQLKPMTLDKAEVLRQAKRIYNPKKVIK